MNSGLNDALAFLENAATADLKPGKVRDVMHGQMDDILEAFYAELGGTEMAQHLGGEGTVERLKSAQQNHWLSLFDAEVSEDVRAAGNRIGTRHAEVGLSQSWYIAAYGWVIVKLIPMMMKRKRLGGGDAEAMLQTLVVRLFSDMTISLNGYEEKRLSQAVDETNLRNIETLGQMSETAVAFNDIMLQLSFLQQNSTDVATNGQAISAAASELVASVDEIARNSDCVSNEARESQQSASEGSAEINKLSGSISDIASAVDETANSVEGLAHASDQIGQIITDIENIAAQTNLLALNATIEAARAGDAGKGFAVVAGEVKQLASQTASATDDITKRIGALREGMERIETHMRSSNAAVDSGKGAIGDVLQRMDQIASQVSSVSGRMGEITGILTQQQGTSSEIAANIDAIAGKASSNDELVNTIAGGMRDSSKKLFDNALKMFDAQSSVSLCYMAKIDHVIFKQRTIDACMGRETWAAADMPDHHTCRLGKWYDGIQNETVRAHPAFMALVEPHKQVHAAARAALEAAASGDQTTVSVHLKELDEASQAVLSGLDELSLVIANLEKQAA
ncbi:methyl-accepting chemotaxis protein [Tepidamorphus sp. 3E244]|uniref:methyl-accepting chemotaxis protein n=1 Tax=Tepidamorphus sp. 3E244 TaxID=3385498 RepID=UPI0038FD0BA5